MNNQIKCTNCYDYLTIVDGIGFCRICNDIVIEEDETGNNPIDINDLPF